MFNFRYRSRRLFTLIIFILVNIFHWLKYLWLDWQIYSASNWICIYRTTVNKVLFEFILYSNKTFISLRNRNFIIGGIFCNFLFVYGTLLLEIYCNQTDYHNRANTDNNNPYNFYFFFGLIIFELLNLNFKCEIVIGIMSSNLNYFSFS